MSDQQRPSVEGLTSADFQNIGTQTLRSWLAYWEAVLVGTREPTPGPSDTLGQAPREIAKVSKEIEVREAAGYAGPDRNRSWGT